MSRQRLDIDTLEAGVRACDRVVLAQAITLVESADARDGAKAQELLTRLMPATGHAKRVGITGVPGVGKSTFIDELGTRLLARGHRVAVLAVDPSSSLSGGSILGDKTRMTRLALEKNAYIRPTASALAPGGIARRTRESLLLCEAAGFDVILIETVGVGQGETAVSEMVDFFLVLALAGAGDELQGIKKGILELADAIAVTKADGDGAARARVAMGDLKAAFRYLPRKRKSWQVRTFAVSGLRGEGLDAVWDTIVEHHNSLQASGELAALRAEQQRAWLWALLSDRLQIAFRTHPAVSEQLPAIEAEVLKGRMTPPDAATALLAAFGIGSALRAPRS